MDTLLKPVTAVVVAMLHNYPVLEAILILPLILRRYAWVLGGCALVILITVGVERHNDYSLAHLLSLETLVFLGLQLVIMAGVTAVIFALKGLLLKRLKVAESPPARSD
jgi:hypothetical protein